MYKHPSALDRIRNAILFELHAATADANTDAIEAFETALAIIDKEMLT